MPGGEGRLAPLQRWLRIFGLSFALFALPLLIILPFGGTLVDFARDLGEANPVVAFAIVIALLAVDAVALIPHGLIAALAGSALPLPVAFLATWFGIMSASAISYGIGRFAGRPLARRLLGAGDLASAETRASGISAVLLFATRPVPVVGEVILIAAGIANYPFRRFLIAVGGANVVIAIAYTGLGGAIGQGDPERLMLVAAIGLPLAGAVGYGVVRLAGRK